MSKQALAQASDASSSERVYLMSFPPTVPGCALSFSPFGGKVEVVLRMAGIDYEGLQGNIMDKKQAPKGKLPSLKHGDTIIADSSHIYEYLVKTFPDKMKVFQADTPKQAAQALVVQRALEEGLYFAMPYTNFVADDSYNTLAPLMFADVPWLMRGFVGRHVRKKLVRDVQGQGLARHTLEEVRARVAADLAALNTLLDGNEFLTGATPCQGDCFLFAMMEMAMATLSLGPDGGSIHLLGNLFKEQPNLMRFYSALRSKYCSVDSKSCEHWQRTLPEVLKAGS